RARAHSRPDQQRPTPPPRAHPLVCHRLGPALSQARPCHHFCAGRPPAVDIILVNTVMSDAMPRLHAAADVFRAVADANRRTLLDAMVSGETAVGQLAKACGLSYSAVSQHLAILREAGSVWSPRHDRHPLYRLATA